MPVTYPYSISNRYILTNKPAASTLRKTNSIRTGGGRNVSSGREFPSVGSLVFNDATFWFSQKIIVGANLLGFLLSLLTTKQYHVDLLGTGAFAASAFPSLLSSIKNLSTVGKAEAAKASGVVCADKRIFWSASAVSLWSTKLASFLLYRCIDKGGIDDRLLTTLTDPRYSVVFWMFSVTWGVVCSLPHTLGSASRSSIHPIFLIIGGVMAGIGLGTETLADYQKWSFKQETVNTGKPCCVGLWSMLQHPNYFGNILFWWGISIMNLPALTEPLPVVVTAATSSPRAASATSTTTIFKKKLSFAFRHTLRFRRAALSLLSPVFMWYLFNGQATGSILGDELEKRLAKYGYGVNPEYTSYVDKTPLIIPFTK